jgi:GNAT superfamily N-acetyltransferase
MLCRATPSDLATLLTMVEEYSVLDHHVFDREAAARALRPLLDGDDRGVVWMITASGVDVGYAVVTWGWSIESGGGDALLDEIYVRTRGEGLGGHAVAVILDELRRRGVGRVFLETEARNEGARRLYARHGFRVEPSVWMSRQL